MQVSVIQTIQTKLYRFDVGVGGQMIKSHFGALALKPTSVADIPLIYVAGRSGVAGMKQLSLIRDTAPG